jgi:hypothetical protein
VYITYYGYADNTPPSNQIAYPIIHSVAGGTGTYADPITFAAYQTWSPGDIIYVPFLKKYYIMEDECTDDGPGGQTEQGLGCNGELLDNVYEIDLWMQSGASNSESVLSACEDNWTSPGSCNDTPGTCNLTPIINNPPSNEPVDTTPLLNTSTNACLPTNHFGSGPLP